MSESGLMLRCDGDRYESFVVTAPSPGVTAGQPDLIHDTVGVYAQDADTGDEVAFIYRASKIRVPKRTGSTYGILNAGDKVYFDHVGEDFSSDNSGNVLCGVCLEAAGAADTTVLIDLFSPIGL